MNDENKTIADLLKSIDDKTVDRAEVMPMLQSIERNTSVNTGKAIAAAVGTAVSKAMGKPGGGKKVAPEPAKAIAVPGVVAPEPAKAIAVPGVVAPEPAKAKATSKAASVAPVVAAVAATVPSKKTVYATKPTTTPAVIVRDVSGKFTSKTTGTDGVAQQKQDNQNDKLSSILKDAVGSKKETIKDTAGRMAMGPFYDIGKELLDATGSMRDNAKDETSTMGRLKNWGKAKMGIKPSKAEASHDKAQAKHDKVEAASDKAEAKHDQLQAKADKAKLGAKAGTATGTVVMGGGGGEGGGGFLESIMGGKILKDMLPKKVTGFLSKIPLLGKLFPAATGVTGVTKGGGMLARGAGAIRAGAGTAAKLGGSAMGAISNLAGPLMSGISLPLVAAAGAAAFGIAQFGKALTTGKSDVSDFMDWLTKKATGDKNATLSGKTYDAVQGVKNAFGFGSGGSVRDVIGQVESGNKGYGAYQNKDSGIVSYGKYQFTADSGSLGTVLDKYSANGGKDAEKAKQYSSIIKNGSKQQKEALRNDPQFKSMLDGAKSEKAMADAQEQTFDQNYYNPAMARGSKAGINVVKNQKVAGFLADTEIQAGSGGNQSVIGKAKSKLAQQGLDFKTATEDQQMQALVDSRKEYTLSVADSKARKGDTSTAAMLRSSASSGGRIDQVASTLKNTKIDTSLGYQTAAAAKAGASAVETQPSYTAKPGTQEFKDMQAKFVADTQAPPVQVASAPGTANKNKKGSKGNKKGAVPPVAVAQAEPKPIKAIEPANPTTTAEQPILSPVREAKAKRAREVSTATAVPATSVEVPVQVASTQGTTAVTTEKPRLAKRSRQLAAENMAKQNATVAAVTAAQTPLPQPKPVQLPPPPPVEVPGLERLAKSQEQQAEKKPDVVASAGKGIPNIKTEFDDTMLVLMSYDRI